MAKKILDTGIIAMEMCSGRRKRKLEIVQEDLKNEIGL